MKQKNKALYAGSFDPFTLGHQDLVQRTAPLYDELIVLVSASANKKACFFTPEQRKQLIQQVLGQHASANNNDNKNLENSLGPQRVRVDTTDQLVVQYAQQHKVKTLIRGVRTLLDVEAEISLSRMNQALAPNIETHLVVADSRYAHISSRWVKEILKSKGDISSLVPPAIAQALAD